MPSKKPLRAIVADDDSWFREDAERAIQQIYPDALIYPAWNGKELLQQVKEQKPNFVITDNEMGMFSGLDAIKQLRQSGYRKKICVYCAGDMEEQAKEAGADDFVRKGNLKELQEVIQKYGRIR